MGLSGIPKGNVHHNMHCTRLGCIDQAEGGQVDLSSHRYYMIIVIAPSNLI